VKTKCSRTEAATTDAVVEVDDGGRSSPNSLKGVCAEGVATKSSIDDEGTDELPIVAVSESFALSGDVAFLAFAAAAAAVFDDPP
jgi:hypothetical protein